MVAVLINENVPSSSKVQNKVLLQNVIIGFFSKPLCTTQHYSKQERERPLDVALLSVLTAAIGTRYGTFTGLPGKFSTRYTVPYRTG